MKSLLVAAAAIGHYGDVTGSPLLPLLATLDTFSGTFDCGFRGRGPRIG
jgi:hypothetical protein